MALTASDSLIGRDPELAELRRLLDGLLKGRAAAVLIEGEAGIGKTRLLASLSGSARERQVTVLSGAAHPLQRTRPFGPLVDALGLRPASTDVRRASIGRLLASDEAVRGGMPAAGQLQFRAVEEILDLIEVLSDQGPVLVALDDLHWADDSTLLAFGWMLRRLIEVPVLLAATLRPSPRGSELAQLLDDALRSGATLIEPPPLNPQQVVDLVEAEVGLAPDDGLASALQRAGGNPLWIVELLRSLSAEDRLDLSGNNASLAAGELPRSLRQLILRRLSYLPEGAVGLLRIAALLGDEFSLRDMSTVTGRRATDLVEELGDAFRAGLLADDRGVLAFRHQLVRDAVYEDIPPAARLALHREAADALRAAGAPLAKIASHLVLGAVPPDLDAARALRTAAREAAPRAPGVAVELLRRTLELLPASHPERDETAAELFESLLRSGHVSDAVTIAEDVLSRPHAAELDQPLRFGLIDALSIQNRGRELIEQTDAALRASPEMPFAKQAFLLAQSSFGRTFSGDLVGGELAARRALEIAERGADTAMICWSLTTLAVAVKTQGRFQDAVDCTTRVVRESLAAPDDEARLRGPFFMHGMILCDADRLDEAGFALRRAAEESERLESWWLLPDIQLMATEVRLLSGDWEEAMAALAGGIEFAREHGNLITLPRFRAYLALIAAARGDVAAGRLALAPSAAELTREIPSFGAEFVFYAAAVVEEVAGQPDAALHHLRRFWSLDSERENRYGHRFLAPLTVRLALEHSHPDLAHTVASAAEAAAALAGGVPSVEAAALRCRGLIAQDGEKLRAAVTLAEESGRVLEHASTCEEAAAVLGSAGARAEAARLEEQALELYETLGASWYASRARARLRTLGAHRGARGSRHRPGTGWRSLTKSERAVVKLVAEGLTNREVGKRLYISPHTVNSHLRHSFQKLGVSTRAALAAKAVQAVEDHAFE